jgi:hypothetical protein
MVRSATTLTLNDSGFDYADSYISAQRGTPVTAGFGFAGVSSRSCA